MAKIHDCMNIGKISPHLLTGWLVEGTMKQWCAGRAGVCLGIFFRRSFHERGKTDLKKTGFVGLLFGCAFLMTSWFGIACGQVPAVHEGSFREARIDAGENARMLEGRALPAKKKE